MAFVTPLEAAKTLGITPQRVRQLVKDGFLRASRYGARTILIHTDSLEEYQARRPAKWGRIK